MVSKNKILVGLMMVYVMFLFLLCLTKKAEEYSDTERRSLEQKPELTKESVLSGQWMSDFEKYALDQFPFRESMRKIKAYAAFYGFGQMDNNGIYISDGYAAALDYPMNEKSMEHAAERIRYVYDTYLAGKSENVYYAVIPDKNYYLAKENGYPALDYPEFYNKINQELDFMEYIGITENLSIEDYYKTDTHWRQEKLTDVAEVIGAHMGVDVSGNYEICELKTPFYGVYYGQAALPLKADTLYYLNNEILSLCKVFDFENNREMGIYDMKKAYGKDPYEMFLGGPLSLVTIENPNANTEKELILFRDSFGSSLAPLLVEGYAKITLVDIRYLPSERLGQFVDFENKDVLFLYSVSVLNNSETMK